MVAGLVSLLPTIRAPTSQRFPGYGPNHGFDETILYSAAGNHNVCIWQSVMPTAHPTRALVAARSTVNNNPFGSLDTASAVTGGVHVGGWVIEPDLSPDGPSDVHVYIDSVGYALNAANARPDLPGVFPGFGPNHGYDTVLPAAPGPHTVCAYGINQGPGANVQLGCGLSPSANPPTRVGECEMRSSTHPKSHNHPVFLTFAICSHKLEKALT
jgi:hypothetical protein